MSRFHFFLTGENLVFQNPYNQGGLLLGNVGNITVLYFLLTAGEVKREGESTSDINRR